MIDSSKYLLDPHCRYLRDYNEQKRLLFEAEDEQKR